MWQVPRSPVTCPTFPHYPKPTTSCKLQASNACAILVEKKSFNWGRACIIQYISCYFHVSGNLQRRWSVRIQRWIEGLGRFLKHCWSYLCFISGFSPWLSHLRNCYSRNWPYRVPPVQSLCLHHGRRSRVPIRFPSGRTHGRRADRTQQSRK